MAPHLHLPLAVADPVVFTVSLLVAALVGAGLAWFLRSRQVQATRAAQQALAEQELNAARLRAAEIVKQAEVESQKKLLETMERFERETQATREELRTAEKRLEKREDTLDKKLDVLSTKERKIESAEQRIAQREKELDEKHTQLDQTLAEQRSELLHIAKLTPDEAQSLCLQRIETEVEREAGQLVEKIISSATESAKEKARNIIVQSIQRYAAESTCETVVSTVDVPSDDMKGRIIGREGRNIRAFEKTTGVTVIVDDTPGVVTLTCHDGVRKEIARLTLERLIKDGRIHPTRVEEIHATATQEVEALVAEAGKKAAMEANVNGLHKKVTDTLGRMMFRTSYGQNVLRHSVEVAYLCGMMADELGLDGALARRCGLLHDIGKVIDHESEGSHTKIGAEFVKRFNEPAAVINAVAGHHNDVPATHPYTPLVTAADAISAARPGARRESLERYIKRLNDLETIAMSFPGVKQAYAIEAGREIRVIVDALRIEDRSSLKLARDIAKKIEESMVFPGEIKVTVLREVRATEYAISGKVRVEEKV